MSVVTVARSIAAAEYTVVRLPVDRLQKLIATRLTEDNPLRLTMERAVANADIKVGQLLDNEGLRHRGHVVRDRIALLETAATLERKSAERSHAADEGVEKAEQLAERRIAQADQTRERDVAQAEAEAQSEKRKAREEAAAKAAADRDAMATATQAALAQEADRLERAESAIDTAVERRTAAPSAQLRDAQDTQRASKARRKDAERLAHLADTEREARQH